MNLSKSLDYFDPRKIKNKSIHILGCGAIGSTIAEMITRLGVQNKIHLWDFDTVESKNITNQMFYYEDIGAFKTTAVANHMQRINPGVKTVAHVAGWKDERLTGYVFLCVDSIDLRKEILQKNLINKDIILVMDFRMGLESGQVHTREWKQLSQRKQLLDTMDFTDEEAKKEVPVSACGTELSIVPTIRTICSYGIANFINHCNGKEIKTLIYTDSFAFNQFTVPPTE